MPLQAESVAGPRRDFCVSSTAGVQAVPEMPARSEKPVSISACFHCCLLGRAGKELVQQSRTMYDQVLELRGSKGCPGSQRRRWCFGFGLLLYRSTLVFYRSFKDAESELIRSCQYSGAVKRCRKCYRNLVAKGR